MNLHDKIMNIRLDEEDLKANLPKASFAAYKVGHRDARHEAADLAISYDTRIAELESALTKAREDINWMLNNRTFLKEFVFDYIEEALKI